MIPVTILGMILVLVLVNKLSEKFNAKHDKEQVCKPPCTVLSIYLLFFIGIELGRGTKQKV
jgi:uncharacterized membrane protein